MKTIVFVHGTGVREPAHSTTFGLIQQALNKRLGATNVRVEPCYWGEKYGASLLLKGASIPTFDSTRAIRGENNIVSGGDDKNDEIEYLLSLWMLLYRDPFTELELLALRSTTPEDELPPGIEPPGRVLDDLAKQLNSDGTTLKGESRTEFTTLLTETGVAAYFDQARNDVVQHPSYRKTIDGVVEPLTDYRLAIARALLARCVQLLQEDKNTPEGFMPMDGRTRDRITELLVAAMGGREAGVVDWVKEKAGLLVKGVATGLLERKRGRISSAITPFAADIVMYQTRPQEIRQFIRNTVEQSSEAAKGRGETGEVTVIGHSLGGIAAVDMLVEKPLPVVRHLITVGSQAPLLYELNALPSLPFDRTIADPPHPLPSHFSSSWLNIYDLRDLLSYLATPVFGKYVIDFEVDNGQPFPESHSAYWTNSQVWDAILNEIGA